jgi:cyclopropane-fatty-acyl-phospholipid synthase
MCFGEGEPKARVVIRTKRALRQLLSFREEHIAEAYIAGELDLEGPPDEVFRCRELLKSSHGLSWLLRFVFPLMVGQVTANRNAIHKHYDLDPAFYLSFLDRVWPAYSQGIFLEPEESLSRAIERKFEFATDACHIGPESHVLEVGPGWGAYLRYLLPTGAQVTALANSPTLSAYLRSTIHSPRLTIVENDFLSYKPNDTFSALTMMGVLEHLPQYGAVCRKIRDVLQPGAYAYIDASAATSKKYDMSPFIYKHIFPYNHSFMDLNAFLAAAKKAGLEICSVHDDTDNYQRTAAAWAANLDANGAELQEKYGLYNFRRFRLYLWASAHAFADGGLQCHRVVLRTPT